MKAISTFYSGRPTRGAKLTPICKVIHEQCTNESCEPWKRDNADRLIYRKKGWHQITRIVTEGGGREIK